MRSRLTGTVEEITVERPGIQEIRVRTESGLRAAVNYPQLTGPVATGDSVFINACACELNLGSGGVDFVASVEAGREPESSSGHIIKLRYTPFQFPVLAAESPESPYHELICAFNSLEGAPVVCAEVHSQVAAIATAVKWETKGHARVAYILTEGGALPAPFSRLVGELRKRGIVDAVISAGQAFGGDYEAVNLYSALAISDSVVRADVTVVCQGPGAAGTGTPLGFSGVEQGTALNASASLGGTSIAVVRMSESDPRPRHRGISHHTITVLQRIALCRSLVPIPRHAGHIGSAWRRALEGTGIAERHDIIPVDVEAAMRSMVSQKELFSTMGRELDQDRAFFEAAVAAGLVAGQWVTGSRS